MLELKHFLNILLTLGVARGRFGLGLQQENYQLLKTGSGSAHDQGRKA